MSALPLARPDDGRGACSTTPARACGGLSPAEARSAQQDGALLVDIRPAAQRAAEGLRARRARRSSATCSSGGWTRWATPAVLQAPRYDDLVVVICSGGYASSLAAASLQAIGLHRATDVVGGFVAWREAGLPVTPGP